MRRFLILAGEESGLVYAERLRRELAAALAQRGEQAEFRGYQSEGFATGDLAVMGFWAVLRRLPFFLRVQRRLRAVIDGWRPDAVVTVDYPGLNLKLVELDGESVDFLLTRFNGMQGRLYQADYLKLDVHRLFPGRYSIIGNFPYNISSQIFFKILDDRERVPEVVCMVQKEVAERIAEGPGSKTYGILSVLLQAWYDIEYLFTVEPGAFAPPPKVRSAVIRLRRNGRSELGVDEKLFRKVVKTAFGQRRKTLRNALKPLFSELTAGGVLPPEQVASICSEPVFDLRAERLSVDDFIELTRKFVNY